MSRIDKQRNIIDFTLSSLLRRKGKSVSLILVYIFIVFLLGSVVLFTQAMKKEASLILKGTPEMVIQRIIAGRHDLIPISYIDKIMTIKGKVPGPPLGLLLRPGNGRELHLYCAGELYARPGTDRDRPRYFERKRGIRGGYALF